MRIFSLPIELNTRKRPGGGIGRRKGLKKMFEHSGRKRLM
jgi:hypothetical protein